LLTGFPWISLGYSQIDSPLAGWAPILGVYGLSWLVALTAALLVLIRLRYHHVITGTLLLVWISGWGLQHVQWTQPQGQEKSVALVQGNVPQATKWDPQQVRNRLQRYADLTRPLFPQHQLIVWPENSITVFYDRIKDSYFKPLVEEAKKYDSSLLIGIPIQKEDRAGYYTSMIMPTDDEQMYHKRHLVPFGEYLPLEWLRGLIRFFDLPMSRFSAGATDQKPLEIAGVTAAMSICYEDAFASELLTQLPQATILINGSNNAWFGDSFAPHQHLQIARMRSLETQRPTLRAATNGISAIINSNGEIVERSQQFVAAVVKGNIQPRQGVTPFIVMGNYLIITLLLLGLILNIYMLRRQSPQDVSNSI
jgi:apolipoprotein N-acyltransferase